MKLILDTNIVILDFKKYNLPMKTIKYFMNYIKADMPIISLRETRNTSPAKKG